jgi:hypothetical protein
MIQQEEHEMGKMCSCGQVMVRQIHKADLKKNI